jgi:hypothetical protein
MEQDAHRSAGWVPCNWHSDNLECSRGTLIRDRFHRPATTKITNMKLDAKFYGTIRKAKDGSLVPEEEYVVFLAKDNCFAAVLPMYLEECIKQGADPEQIAAVQRMIERLNAWRALNPLKLKIPDINKNEHLLEVPK